MENQIDPIHLPQYQKAQDFGRGMNAPFGLSVRGFASDNQKVQMALTHGGLPFNPKSPTVMHIDLNSCFATIEQQANPKLRGKPIVVAAYITPMGCIIAPSVEAKEQGVRVGMRVKEGKLLCQNLIVLTPDPWKYRNVHVQFRRLLEQYSDHVVPKSIDEFVLDLEGYPSFSKGMTVVAKEIKDRIKKEVGEWLKVSIGIGPNRFLAKLGAGLHKPDGLDIIDEGNVEEVYAHLPLTNICGIKTNNAVRLNQYGIFTTLDFYRAPVWKLKAAFASIVGYYWYVRLHGWEIDDVEFGRGSFGNSYALPDMRSTPEELSPLLTKLVEKSGSRMRKNGYRTRGVHLSILYRDGCHWHKGVTISEYLFDTRDIYKVAYRILCMSPYRKPVANIAVSCFSLEKSLYTQEHLFSDIGKKENLIKAVDAINEKWGDFVITPGRMMGLSEKIIDRVAFGNIKELEDMVLAS
jgi:DNA polymerase-4